MDLNLVKYLSIDDKNIKVWCKEIINYNPPKIKKQKIKSNIIKKGFDVTSTLLMLDKIYGCDLND